VPAIRVPSVQQTAPKTIVVEETPPETAVLRKEG